MGCCLAFPLTSQVHLPLLLCLAGDLPPIFLSGHLPLQLHHTLTCVDCNRLNENERFYCETQRNLPQVAEINTHFSSRFALWWELAGGNWLPEGKRLETRDTLSIRFFEVFYSERYQAPILGLEEGNLTKERKGRTDIGKTGLNFCTGM